MNGSRSSGTSSPKMSNGQQGTRTHTSPYLTHSKVKHAMDAPVFVPQGLRQTNTSNSPYQLAMSAVTSSDREGIPSTAGASYSPAILIRRLPPKTTSVDSLRSMFLWSKDFLDAEVIIGDNPDDWVSAIVRFKDAQGAQEAQVMLNGKPNMRNDANMIVEILQGSPTMARRYPSDGLSNGAFHTAGTASSTSSASSAGPTPRQSSRFNGTFQSMERISPPNAGSNPGKELPNPESSTHYQSLFSPQSPIGNHLTERTRVSGKSLINDDAAADDETGELLKDPVAYAENGPSSVQPRRGTNPQLPITRMASLSLSTNNIGSPGSMSVFPGPAQMGSLQPLSAPMSPTLMANGGAPMQYQLGNQHYQRHSFPPVNPADQNPPCNTLYVGNLPIDTSEDELKAMFSKQRGYKRLCFRTKQNGPMCFVEFEDVSFATKALHELYGHPLHNSVKGGIRLSFSKNPLGVRSGQGSGAPGPVASPGALHGMGGMPNGASGGSFSTANGPPPGLTAPPGLGPSRVQYGAIHNPMTTSAAQYGVGAFGGGNWNGPLYSGPVVNQATTLNGASGGFPPAYMMGR